MSASNKTYVRTVPRHHRILVLVNETITESKLISIMVSLQQVWGGRYNPIIPIINNAIPGKWLDMVKYYDADFIYYPESSNLEIIKSYPFFQPLEYREYDEEYPGFNVPGVNTHNLLFEHVAGNIGNEKLSLLQHSGKWSMSLRGGPFYQLNLGFKELYAGENKWVNQFNLININEENVTDINKRIYEDRPFFKSILSGLHINSRILERGKTYGFQWIVYTPGSYFYDLLYFWNRQQFIEPGNQLSQVVCSVDQFLELSEDPFFIGLLYRLCYSSRFSLASTTLSEAELAGMRKNLQEKNINVQAKPLNVPDFPFEYNSASYVSSNFLTVQNNLIVGKTDFLKYAPLVFENGSPVLNGLYAVDAIILRDEAGENRELKFPLQTALFHLVCKVKARVNCRHRISLFVDCKENGTEFHIPGDIEIIRNVLQFRMKQNEHITLPVNLHSLSSSGQKIAAFFKLFNSDWGTIKQFLEELFWLDLFRYNSPLKGSSIPPGRGVFSYQDLEKEVNGLFEKYRSPIIEKINKVSGKNLDMEVIERIIARDKKEAFVYHIDSGLDFLIERSGILIGMKVSCTNCGSNKWYSLNELGDMLKCKGCNTDIKLGLKSKIYYKLSEIITNNLLSDLTKSSKHYDGNYVVLKTLSYLQNDPSFHSSSFTWSPPVNFTTPKEHNSFDSDLDILAIQDGKLIIGEGKADAGMFNAAEIKQLIWLANNLMPDIIILACAHGNLDATVAKVKAGLTNPNCEVIAYTTGKPWYHFHGLFGLPGTEKRNDDKKNA